MSVSKSIYLKNEEGLFVCPHCGVTKCRQNTMYYHIKKHTGELNYKCETCDKRFVQKSGLKQHVAQVHPEVAMTDTTNMYANVLWKCPCCEHSCRMKANLLIHIARKHCIKWIPADAEDHACSGCEKEFSSSTAYYYHAIQCFKVPETFLQQIRVLSA
jgi:hypothetical protein